MERSALDKNEPKQTGTPNKGDSILAPFVKVVDFATARKEVGKDKAPKEKAPSKKQNTTEPKERAAVKVSKTRPVKADKATP